MQQPTSSSRNRNAFPLVGSTSAPLKIPQEIHANVGRRNIESLKEAGAESTNDTKFRCSMSSRLCTLLVCVSVIRLSDIILLSALVRVDYSRNEGHDTEGKRSRQGG